MADRERHNGRMLFTDFDASDDKGRPVAARDGRAAQAVLDAPAPELLTLEEIAAQIGLDFEADGDEPADAVPPAPPPAPTPPPAQEQAPPTPPADALQIPPEQTPEPEPEPESILEPEPESIPEQPPEPASEQIPEQEQDYIPDQPREPGAESPPPAPPLQPLPQEIAEDPAPPPPPPPQPAESAAAVVDEDEDGDAELELTLPDLPAAAHFGAFADAAPTPPDAAPSWNEFAQAFAQAKPVEALAPLMAPGAPALPSADPAADAGDDGMLDDEFTEDVDVLSMLDVLLDAESAQQTAGQTAAHTADQAGETSPEQRHSTTRIVAPARAIPYGGIERIENWFSPPEVQPGEVARVADWYAPPTEEELAAAAAAAANGADWMGGTDGADGGESGDGEDDPGETKVDIDISWLSEFSNELPGTDSLSTASTRILPAAPAQQSAQPFAQQPARQPGASSGGGRPGRAARGGEGSSPADTMELFTDMDFDGMWEKKVEVKQQSRPAPDKGTRTMSLLDNIDVDTLWEKKKEEARKSGRLQSLPEGKFPGSADQTLILESGSLPDPAGAGTVILSRDLPRPRVLRPDDAPPSAPEVESVLAELDGLDAASASRRMKAKARPAAENAAPGEEDDILASVPADAEPGDGEAEQGGGTADPAAAGKNATGKKATGTVAPGESASGGGAEDGIADASGGSAQDAPFPGAADAAEDGADAPDASGTGAPAGDAAARVIGGASADAYSGDGDGEDFVARKPFSGAPGKSLTTDELLDEIDGDLGADGVAADVAPPVIGDDAISAVGAGGAVADAGASGDAEEPSAAAGVAVNPMDVFADMDNMDFSDDVDDDMRAMMEEELADEEGGEEGGASTASGEEAAVAEEEELPTTRFGLLRFRAGKIAKRVLPMKTVDKALTMVAWRENWWFYCDLVAAVVASASLAVIVSYLFWYRGA